MTRGREGEVVFTRGGYANEAVNNDGFLLFPSRSLYSFFFLVRASRVFHRVGGIIEKGAKREREGLLSPAIMTALCEVPLRAIRARLWSLCF